MPVRTVPNTNPPLRYYLVAFDENGRERRESDNSLLSERILQTLRGEPITDVLTMSHGWMGDVPAAVAQYDNWTRNLMSDTAGFQAVAQRRPGYQPLLIGLHWPSLPWGQESLSGTFGIDPTASTALDETVDKAAAGQAALLAAGPQVEQELRTIYRSYATTDDPETLPAQVEQAYRRLHDLLRPTAASALPAEGMPPFDPRAVFDAARRTEQTDIAAGSFGFLNFGTLLSPLRVLSFWRMKDRARNFGEGGAHALLQAMQAAVAGKDVRFHLMGHSFGCIVMTGTATGPKDETAALRPVQSMVLVQGALSLWAFCPSLPHAPATSGYFHRLLTRRRCEGPIAVTQSQYDTAVGRAYPLAAGLAGQDDFADPTRLPEYGGIGTWGIQGLDAVTEYRQIAGTTTDYKFQPWRIYNVRADSVISGNNGQYDAHSDIVHPEVAHLLWQAQL